MNFSNVTPDEEMSMEDILSSIRKYVSEEDEKREREHHQSQEPKEESVIKLEESNIVSPADVQIKEPDPAVIYQEKSEEAKIPEAPAKKSNPFGQLAAALNSYGKQKPQLEETQKQASPTIDEFFKRVTEQMVEKWINENMPAIVEKVVLREIEKIKSEN